jgi:hypothetical protein
MKSAKIPGYPWEITEVSGNLAGNPTLKKTIIIIRIKMG